MRQLIFILLAIIGVSQAQTIQYIGAPTTTVISRGNFRTDSIFYLPKRSKAPTDTAALRYQISDSSLYAWTGSQWRKVGADADTLIYSTRAWRQKGDDSLAARINLKVNISDTASMLTPYLRKSDTTSMLTAYLRKGDTASMLSPYYRSAAASAALALKLNIFDTSTMLSPYYRSATATAALATKLNISDTATMLSPYARTATMNASLATKVNISDTSTMLSPYIRHAGYGLTKSGQTLTVDTLNIATRAWRQKGIDSVSTLITARPTGTGTANILTKWTGTNTQGNSSIFDNGTVVSASTPVILNPATAGASYLQLKNNSTDVGLLGSGASIDGSSAGDLGLFVYGSNNLDMWTNGFRRMRIFGNGRVFVGSSPTDAGYQLDVNGTLRSVNGANFATTSGDVGIGTTSPNIYSSAAHKYLTVSNTAASGYSIATVAGGAGGGGEIDFGNQTIKHAAIASLDGSILGFYTNNTNSGTGVTERMRITSNGNVGIGTTSPATKLDVNGIARVSTSDQSTNRIRLFNQISGNTWDIVGGLNGANNTDFSIYDGTNTRFVINTSGNVGIGTTSPSGKLHVIGAAANTANIHTATSFSTFTSDGFSSDGVRGLFVGTPSVGDHLSVAYYSFGNEEYPVAMRFYSGGSEGARNSSSTPYIFRQQGAATVSALWNNGGAYFSQNVGIGTASPVGDGTALNIYGSSFATIKLQNSTSGANTTDGTDILVASSDLLVKNRESGSIITYTANTERGRINAAGEWILNADGTDAGDYKLQVVGNARIGTGKLDIASNTVFGLGVARSGTSEVAGQIYNSNGILYLGAESSAGGQIFSGSSAYAGVIGTGANYPLQFATNNATRATINTNGELLINTTTDAGDYKLQVSGNGYLKNGQVLLDSVANKSALFVSQYSVTGSASSNMIGSTATWNTTGNPALIDFSLTNTASGSDANYIKISDGTNTFRVTKEAEVVTAAPTGGSIRKWKLGEAATVSPTSPNRTIRVEIDGTVYYLHAKTTND